MNGFNKKQVNILFFSCLLLLFSCAEKKVNESSQNIQKDSVVSVSVEKRDSFMGIDIEGREVQHGRIPNNQTLGGLLSDYGLTARQIHDMELKSRPIFNVRKIKAGNPYHIIQSADTIHKTDYFVYEVNMTEYVVYDLTDTISVSRFEKDLVLKDRVVTGVIESSLWNSVVGQGVPFELALELSNIYAWNIDFFGLQKGDRYTVQYVEVLCDSNFVRIDTVKCAKFTHCGTDFYAIPFTQKGRRDYYDYDGASLRKAFLKAPLSYSRISSHFSHSRFHPVLKYYRPHHGVDYAAPTGTPVMTIGDGRVVFKGWTKGGGNTVKIQHNSVYTTVYMHLSKFGKISQGSVVKQGEVIGYVGSTGISTGPHLDFRVYENGTPVNPLKVKSPPVEPVDSLLMPQFMMERDSMLKKLVLVE